MADLDSPDFTTRKRDRHLPGWRPSWKGEIQMKLGISMASLVLLVTACGVVADPLDSTGASVRASAEAVTGAETSGGDGNDSSLDRVGHPAPGKTTGTPCGPSRCAVGQFCCNESCGICAPHGGVCLQRQCGPSAVALTECTSDSDCRAFSSYCDGCQCLGCGMLDPDPSCHATVVACILDPCHHQYPACVNGTCSLVQD